MSDEPPPDILQLVDVRSAHRARHDYVAADAVRERLRQLGWEVVDGPAGSSVRPILPADATAERFGGTQQLASRLGEPSSIDISIQVLADDDEGALRRFLRGLSGHLPTGPAHEVVIVANAPSFDLRALLASPSALPVEIVASSQRLGWADARNLGLRRSRGEITIVCDAAVEPLGDFVTLLAAAFDDPAVGLAGPWGMRSGDARRFTDALPGEVDALQAYCLAVRRLVLRDAGLFDGRFRFYRNADLDFSFQARAAGWRAIQVADLPLRRHRPHAYAALPADELERLSRRNFYRFLKRWGNRRDLLLQPEANEH